MFKLIRQVPLNGTSAQVVLARRLSTLSLIESIIRKLNKTFHGSETPFKKNDDVLDQVMAAEKWNMPKVFAKSVFLRDRARANFVKHNARIRKLEDKVTGGAFGIKSFQNRF